MSWLTQLIIKSKGKSSHKQAITLSPLHGGNFTIMMVPSNQDHKHRETEKFRQKTIKVIYM